MHAEDVPAVYRLMRELAAFEGYLDAMVVRESDVLRYGLGPDRQFTCFVARHTSSTEIAGYAVIFEEPWNYQLAPTFVLKEFYTARAHRSAGVGTSLFHALTDYVRQQGGVRLRWLVLSDNQPAAGFYQKQGGCPSSQWNLWEFPALSSP